MKFTLRRKKIMKAIALFLILTAVLLTSLPGCGEEGTPEATISVPTSLSELSLVQLWDKLMEGTDFRDDTISLESFSVTADNDSQLTRLSLEIYAIDEKVKIKYFRADLSLGKGEMRWYSYDTDTFPASYSTLKHPLAYFEELDNLGLGAIEQQYGDFTLLLEVGWGEFSLNNKYVPLYYLHDGLLTPLKEVAFDNTGIGYGIVTFFEHGSGSWTARWLIVDDISKASTLEYLKT